MMDQENRHNCEDILRDLVAFKTISRLSNEDLILYLEQFLKPLGFDLIRIKCPDEPERYNLLARIGPDVPGGLMLSGHTDVVPVQGQNWQSDPFVLTKQDGRLIGRGATDMKGFIAATLFTLKNFPLKNLTKPLSLLFTYDEEVGCQGSQQAAALLNEYFTHMPTAALIGEPTDFNILRMHAGHVTMKIHAKGKGAHSSDPDLGINAIKAMNKALTNIFLLEEQLKSEKTYVDHFKRPFVTLNVGEIHGGSAVNIIPDEAEILVGFRPMPDTSVDTMVNRIHDAAINAQTDERIKINTTMLKCTPAMVTPAGTKLEQILLPLANTTQSAAQYATDGGNLRTAGLECLIFGPGSIDVAHQANEWILLEDLLVATKKLEQILRAWFHK